MSTFIVIAKWKGYPVLRGSLQSHVVMTERFCWFLLPRFAQKCKGETPQHHVMGAIEFDTDSGLRTAPMSFFGFFWATLLQAIPGVVFLFVNKVIGLFAGSHLALP